MIILKRDLNNRKKAGLSGDIVCVLILFTEFKMERIIRITHSKILPKANKWKSQKSLYLRSNYFLKLEVKELFDEC